MLPVKRYMHTILTCAGAVGLVVTTVVAIKATPKAYERIEQAKKEKGDDLTKLEVVKVAAPVYIPTVLIGAGTLACMFGANVLNKRQQAALISAYTLIDNSYKEYKKKLVELYGEEVHQNVVDAIAAEKAEEMHITSDCLCARCDMSTDDYSDPILFYDEYNHRYFEAPIEQVLMAEYHINRNFVLRGYTTLNEFYEFLGIEQTNEGDALGWAFEDELYWIDFNHRKTVLDDDLECYIIETPYGPSSDFLEYYY